MFKNSYKLWARETFIFVEKPNVALEGEWKNEENGLMVQLDLPCSIFDENESEEIKHLLEMVDAFAKSKSDKLIVKINPDVYNEFKMYLKRIKILSEEVVSNNQFYKMCMSYHQTLKKVMYEMSIQESDLVKRIGDLEIKSNTL